MTIRVVGIIPARGGSKGIPRKNLRTVAGKPLIAYAIGSAYGCARLERTVLTTDDIEIAETARALDCEVLERPSKLAADETPMVAVIEHVLSCLPRSGEEFDAFALLQPTSPMRTSSDIDRAISILETTEANSVISVYRVQDAHPARMYHLIEGVLVPYDNKHTNSLRQSLPALYHRNGAIYLCRTKYFLDHGNFVSPDCRPYIMPRSRSLNIDEEFDCVLADAILRSQVLDMPSPASRDKN